jgi:RsiW-degrading membrane proteinase PrsW (M82 family)
MAEPGKGMITQNYGALRVVRVRSARSPDGSMNAAAKYPTGWLPEEGLVHVLTGRVTTIGRALNNDVVLMDPTVSREHARLVLDQNGWYIINLTTKNIVRVNGKSVPSGSSLPMHPQDVLILGSTMLQLIAPQHPQTVGSDSPDLLDDITQVLPSRSKSQAVGNVASIEQQRKTPQSLPVPPQEYQQLPAPSQQARAYNGNAVVNPEQNGHAQPPGQVELPDQPEPEHEAQHWEDDEDLLGASVTMHFALPQRLGIRSRWLIAGIGLAILVISASITIILNSLLGFAAFTQNGTASIIAALTIPIIPVVGIFLLVNFMDRYEKEPWYLLLAAFLWGAIIAIPPALFIEGNIDNFLQNYIDPNTTSEVVRIALQGLNAGITEETVKGMGLLLLFFVLRDEFDDVVDGIIYGALIGAGFAMVENFRYFALDSKNFLVFLIVGRILLGWLGHSTFIACFGAALGYVRYTRVRWKQIVIPLLGFLIAIGLHTFFDFVDFQASAVIRNSGGNPAAINYALIAIIANYLPPFLAQLGLLYILIRGLAHETAIIREFLADEVSDGIVSVGEYALLQNSFHRTHVEREVFRRSGFKQWLRVKDLYQTEIGLAFRKWHVSMGDKPKLGYIQPEDAYRQRIKRLRKEIKSAEQIA